MGSNVNCPKTIYVVWTTLGSVATFQELTDAEDAVKAWTTQFPDHAPYVYGVYDLRETA